MTQYYDNTPFTDYFRARGSFSIINTPNPLPTLGRAYHLMCPCSIKGIRFYNALPGDTSFRFGLWSNLNAGVEIEHTQCRVETTLAQGTHTVMFTESLPVDWDDIVLQRDLGYRCWWIAIRVLSGTDYDNGSPIGFYPMPALSIVQPGLACLPTSITGSKGTFVSGGSWECPNYTTALASAMDMLVVADESPDGYSRTPHPYIYGAAYSGVSLDTTTGDRTVGVSFYPHHTGRVLYGMRFYTHDTNPWGGTLKAWYPNNGSGSYTRLDSVAGTVSCTGQGIYDVLFPTPITITETHLQWMGAGNGGICVGIRNTTNTNFTVTNRAGATVLPLDRAGQRFEHHWMNDTFARYGSGDTVNNWNMGSNLCFAMDALVGS
jgi:hypothetical protein